MMVIKLEKKYKILRFHFLGQTELIKEGLTLEEARKHCQRKDTRSDFWFDGFAEME